MKLEANMGNRSFQIKASILLYWALIPWCIAEQKYFLLSRALSWDQARNHCKVCYEDLVTLTPENIQTIVKNLTSAYWIGLRKNSSTTGLGAGLPWSQWANGDPLTFQNWYPDWASPNPEFEYFRNISNSTGHVDNVTQQATQEQNVTTTMGPNIMHTVDFCAAMAGFGAWTTEDCSKLLPFICYEDHSSGNIMISDVTSSSATLTWLAEPSDISHYRIEVTGLFNHTLVNQNNLVYDLSNLTAGTFYSVRVFPVKCDRDLNPHTGDFYTVPRQIQNPSVTSVTETSVVVNWTRPVGNVDFYRVEVVGSPALNSSTSTESVKVSDLIPGNHYTMRILTGVRDKSKWGEAVTVTVYTRPSKVSNLRVSENNGKELLLKWAPPTGNISGYRVEVLNESNSTVFFKNVSQNNQRVWVTGLPPDSKISLIVTSLANDSLGGDPVMVTNFTAPSPVSNLNVPVTAESITASWSSPGGSVTSFIAELQIDGSDEKVKLNVTKTMQVFDNLKSGASYTVTIYAVNGHLRSQPVSLSNITLPQQPGEVSTSSGENQIVLTWTAPKNSSATISYSVKIHEPFWDRTWHERVDNTNTITIGNLKSGTLYRFEVRTVVGPWKSEPRTASHYTVAVTRKITLSMLCSSGKSLFCDQSTTRTDVFNKLKTHLSNLLGENIIWELKQMEP